MRKSFTNNSLYYRVPFKMVHWISFIYFSLKSPLKLQNVNLKTNQCLAMLKNNKGHHGQIKKVEKFMKVQMHVALNWRGNLNREPQLQTGGDQDHGSMWAASPTKEDTTSQQYTENKAGHGKNHEGYQLKTKHWKS